MMFPEINLNIIEMILRKYEGDVSSTIDELLNLNSSNASTSSSFQKTIESNKLKQREIELK